MSEEIFWQFHYNQIYLNAFINCCSVSRAMYKVITIAIKTCFNTVGISAQIRTCECVAHANLMNKYNLLAIYSENMCCKS
jgi:hypothetical protein